jgi:hypothetical protein
MGNLIYLAVTVLLNTWIIGFLGYHAGIVIHVLLILAIYMIAYRVFQEYKRNRGVNHVRLSGNCVTT